MVLFLSIAIRVYSQNPSPTPFITSHKKQIPTESIDNRTNKEKKDTNLSTSFNKTLTTQNDQQKTNDHSRNQNNKSMTDWWIMVATIAIAAFALLQVIAMILQYLSMRKQVGELRESIGETKKAADAAKKSAESLPLVERAYIFAKVEGTVETEVQPEFGNRGFTGHHVLSAHIFLSNHGKTPAIITKVNVGFSTKNPELPKPEASGIPSVGLVLGSDKWYRFPACTYRGTMEELDNIRSQDPILFCCGVVEYEDVFKNPQRHGFCWEYRPSGTSGEESWVISLDHKELNYNT